jgi:iron(III) transport system permease protein
VIFLTSPRFDMATVNIVGRAEVGEYGYATAYASVLIVLMIARRPPDSRAVGRRRLSERTDHARTPSRRSHEAGSSITESARARTTAVS